MATFINSLPLIYHLTTPILLQNLFITEQDEMVTAVNVWQMIRQSCIFKTYYSI